MTDNPYAALERIFHEPNRLSIMSALCAAPNGLTFKELKDDCKLTDGNLSRHLKTLQESGSVLIEKSFVGARPRTTAFLSDTGRDKFLCYLSALESVLKRAAHAAAMSETQRMSMSLQDIPAPEPG
jgi:DNA-binding transcriptional ArsR family regulator